ncbi:dephospho-CoA kinase [Camelimonas lactis]|uniref:Dephospho-CoA kinase n=1 Tax=Camelimonas lactis TaxID=659006 RepID=A0A4R2GYA5_9HYPH|nr:dephospho-CoA kinase [Camelimonas lactis]TCO14681.1 dephospho-CoA kinase [Camelimonas lactis]
MTFILGLTGSIGMGKSATSAMFREMGAWIYDADAAVHAIYAGPATPLVEAAFPGVADENGVVNRERLGAAVLGDAAALKRLESIVHPLLRQHQLDLVRQAVEANVPVLVMDVPLLFETGGDRRCDAVAVVSADPEIQRERVLARPGMTPEKFEMIHVKQMPDAEKRRRAHFIIDTGHGFDHARRQVGDILKTIAGREGAAAKELLAAA